MNQATRTYEVWRAMKRRCLDVNHIKYSNYGGRGITVCISWMTYDNFLADMGLKPDGLTLERVDNNKGYCKENCKWATQKEQSNNRRPRKACSATGISGVNIVTPRREPASKELTYRAVGSVGRRSYVLYKGLDFFEACCARKSWEAHRGYT